MNFLELFQTLGSNLWIYGGTFIVILSILVFVHEWGHYIVARLCGVRVESFSIGFGKEIFGWNDKNGTRWKFSYIPLGGYVKLYGDVDPASAGHTDNIEGEDGQVRPMTEEERQSAFFSKPVWKRASVVFAGPAINYIFAFLLLCGLYMLNGKPVTPPLAAAIIGGSSAEKYGFEPHDEIVSIDGQKIYSFEDIRTAMMIALDEERHFVVNRGGQNVDIYAKPEKVEQEDRFGFKHSRGLLGLISPRHAIQISNILEIDGQEFDAEDLSGKQEALKSRLGQKFTIVIARGSKTDTLIVLPVRDQNEGLFNAESEESSILFVAAREGNEFVKYGLIGAAREAINQTYVITAGTLEALGQMITGTRSATELGGIIRIGAVAGDMAQQGIIALILFTALLSINLGLINLFPIPMLDGGHLVFYAFEAILGKPIPEQIQEYAFRFGLFFLVCIMVFANLNDILQLVL
ncbi:MAG: RIP metalloprotease RseP [Micavibrio sp.]|nr:RIP metalloprotease RseP [Micavibrio sp.]|tara:strand:- start:4618 stop:6006 length:1389 start_codon:yes stop_codon:yes gene_type:complete